MSGKKREPIDDGSPLCPHKAAFIDELLAKRGLTVAKAWPARPPKEKPPVRPVPVGEAA